MAQRKPGVIPASPDHGVMRASYDPMGSCRAWPLASALLRQRARITTITEMTGRPESDVLQPSVWIKQSLCTSLRRKPSECNVTT